MKSLAIFALAALLVPACVPTVQPDPRNAHIIRSIQDYPKTLNTYCDDALMQQATMSNSCIIIYIPIQRGRFYVNGRIAADFPVSTGRDGTPTLFSFRVQRKMSVEEHVVSKDVPVYEYDEERDSYGIVRARTPRLVGSEQRSFEDNMQYMLKGAYNPCFLHAYPVTKPGVRESGGSVRVPPAIQKKLFRAVQPGTVVFISRRLPSPDGHDELLEMLQD